MNRLNSKYKKTDDKTKSVKNVGASKNVKNKKDAKKKSDEKPDQSTCSNSEKILCKRTDSPKIEAASIASRRLETISKIADDESTELFMKLLQSKSSNYLVPKSKGDRRGSSLESEATETTSFLESSSD